MAKKSSTRKASTTVSRSKTTKRKGTKRTSSKKGKNDIRSLLMFIVAFVLVAVFLAMLLSSYWLKNF